MRTRFSSENLKGRAHMGDPDVGGRINIRGMRLWAEFRLLRIGINGGLSWTH